jgi:hypothetical protein
MQNNSALTNSINLLKPNIQMILHWEYMNNTKTRALAIVTVLIAATLVVGMTFAVTATTTQSAFAYQMKGAGQDDGSNNGNTLTPQTGRQYGIVSGFDNSFNQELKNLICTHPSATCSTEGSEGPENTAIGSSGSSPQHETQGLKEDEGSHRSPSSSCTVGSFSDLVHTICIPLPMP